MKRIVFFIALWVGSMTLLQAQGPKRVPAVPYPLEVIQPNGDTLTIRLIGDEHYHFRTTLDGWLIKQNRRGYYCYAYYNKKGETVASRRKAHNAEKRTKREIKYLEKNIPQRGKRE